MRFEAYPARNATRKVRVRHARVAHEFTGAALCGALMRIEWDRFDELDFERLPEAERCGGCSAIIAAEYGEAPDGAR